MVSGVRFWNDQSRFWVQTKDGVESILKKELPAGADGIHHGWLESCGPSSLTNCLDSMGLPVANQSPGGASIRPMDFFTVWVNTPENADLLRTARPDIDPNDFMDNEIPQYYAVAVNKVFGVNATYYDSETFDWIASIVASGKGCMICLKNPGHFLAVVAYDDETQELIYNDSWPGRTGTSGFNLRMGRSEFEANVNPFVVVIG